MTEAAIADGGIASPKRTPAVFLIVDDDIISVRAIRRVFTSMRVSNPITVAGDGIEALEHLRGSIVDGRLPPYIVLLDLNMPRMDGHEFLRVIRDDPLLKRLVVFIVTTSDAPSDVAAAYDRHVAGYIVKDEETESLRGALAALGAYSQVMLLPPLGGASG